MSQVRAPGNFSQVDEASSGLREDLPYEVRAPGNNLHKAKSGKILFRAPGSPEIGPGIRGNPGNPVSGATPCSSLETRKVQVLAIASAEREWKPPSQRAATRSGLTVVYLCWYNRPTPDLRETSYEMKSHRTFAHMRRQLRPETLSAPRLRSAERDHVLKLFHTGRVTTLESVGEALTSA